MDAQTSLRKEECAEDMKQGPNYAAAKDAPIKLGMKESVLSTEQGSYDAAAMDAQTMLRKEECALDMEQRSNYAAVKDARIVL